MGFVGEESLRRGSEVCLVGDRNSESRGTLESGSVLIHRPTAQEDL